MTRIFFRVGTGTENRFWHFLIVPEWFQTVSNMSRTQLRCPRALRGSYAAPELPLRWARSSGAPSSGTVHDFVHPQVEVGGGHGGGGGNFETSLDHPSPPDPSQLQDDLAPRLKSLRKKVAQCHVVSMQNHRTKRLPGSRAAGNQSSYDFPAPKIFLAEKNL